jgi:asparagine synthase (glutamine-hydrolysing)
VSVLFGFWGAPSRVLRDTMSGLLAHRGESESIVETPYATIGVRFRSTDQASTRLVEERHPNTDHRHLVGLAGHLTKRDSSFDMVNPGWRGAWAAVRIEPDSLCLARDAAGARSIAWGRIGERILFASEPKAIARAPGFKRQLRYGALAQYLSFSFVPERESMIQNVFRLGPGECATFREPTRPTYHRWFKAEENEGRTTRSDADWVMEFAESLRAAVRERLPNTEPAATLSGGIDSSIIASLVASEHPQPLQTYTAHFGFDAPNELAEARSVADHVGTQHEEVRVDPADFLPNLEAAIWHLDDPIGDPVTIGNYALARAMRGGRHIFNGEGGDPLFGGPKNLTMALHHAYGGVDHSEGFRERAYLRSYRRAYTEIPHVLSEDSLKHISPKRDLENVLTPFFDAERPQLFLNRLLSINTRLKGAHLILPKVERMMAAGGLVALSPLFDERLLRLSMAMPAHLKVSKAVEKVVLKMAFGDQVPRAIVDRKKSGMRVPVHQWFKGPMKRYARKLLSPRALKRDGLFRPERVKQWLDYDIAEGSGRYGLRLWMLVTFETWRRVLLE